MNTGCFRRCGVNGVNDVGSCRKGNQEVMKRFVGEDST